MLDENIATSTTNKPTLEKSQTADDSNQGVMEQNSSNTSQITAPFIYFFEYGMKYGLFKDLGQVSKIQEENKVYSSYIDNWLSYAIKNKIIEIKSDGIINYLEKKPKKYLFQGEKNSIKLESIANTITKFAVKNTVADPQSLSTCNFYAIKNSPAFTKKYIGIVSDFFKKISQLSEESFSGPDTDDIHYVSLSTCTLNKEDFNDI